MNINKKVIIIAEAGVNHNGSVKIAKKLVDLAKLAGADYVKFQIFNTQDHIVKNTKLTNYQIKNLKKKVSQYKMIKKLELSDSEFKKIYSYTKQKKIKFLLSCFDLTSLNFYLKLNPEIIKIPSGEITNLPLLEKIGKARKKVILSTGMSTYKEIKDALKILVKSGTKLSNITVMQCTTDYPCKIEDVNLNVIPELIKKFKCKVGFSDHTQTHEAAIISVLLGSSVIEKHITLNHNMKGPDHIASFDLNEFKSFVLKLRNINLILGKKNKFLTKGERDNINLVRKSLVALKYIKKGEKFSKKNIGAKRPGNGVSPMKIYSFIGKKSKKNFIVNEKII